MSFGSWPKEIFAHSDAAYTKHANSPKPVGPSHQLVLWKFKHMVISAQSCILQTVLAVKPQRWLNVDSWRFPNRLFSESLDRMTFIRSLKWVTENYRLSLWMVKNSSSLLHPRVFLLHSCVMPPKTKRQLLILVLWRVLQDAHEIGCIKILLNSFVRSWCHTWILWLCHISFTVGVEKEEENSRNK